FQAEDGIRDFHVTGVQTCALPIFWENFYIDPLEDDPAQNSNKAAIRIRNLVTKRSIDGVKLYHYFKNGGTPGDFAPGYPALDDRSEERRVGKECRAWWSRDVSKKE